MIKATAPLSLIALLLAAPVLAGDTGRLQQHEKGIWSIAGTATANRWIVIHDLPEAAKSGIYHIEVLARGKTEPKWKVERVRPHLAITERALDRSVIKPLAAGAVYPESFDDAYRLWKEEAGAAFICETSVLECLEGK